MELPPRPVGAKLHRTTKTRSDRGAKSIQLLIKLTHRQRQALIALSVANLVALSALALYLLRPTLSPEEPFSTSPLDTPRLEACRQATSQSLLEAGQGGMVVTQPDGTVLIQLQRPLITDSLRLDADGATWVALEAVAQQAECLGFRTVQVDVLFELQREASNEASAQTRRATARANMPDLMLWSLGKIDDAELAQRLDYQPPATLAGTAVP